MKLTHLCKATMVAVCIGLAAPISSQAAPAPVHASTPSETPEAMIARIGARVAEIEQMDKSELSNAEKRALKKELKKMYKQADGLDKKVYISVGAIIIAILLLLLILT